MDTPPIISQEGCNPKTILKTPNPVPFGLRLLVHDASFQTTHNYTNKVFCLRETMIGEVAVHFIISSRSGMIGNYDSGADLDFRVTATGPGGSSRSVNDVKPGEIEQTYTRRCKTLGLTLICPRQEGLVHASIDLLITGEEWAYLSQSFHCQSLHLNLDQEKTG